VQHSRYIIAFVVATEISILANFVPQDRVAVGLAFLGIPAHHRLQKAPILRKFLLQTLEWLRFAGI